MLGRVAYGTQLYFGRTRGYTNHHAQRRREQTVTSVHHLDQSAHHLLAGREVGNHTVSQRTYGTYIVMCLLIHHLGLLAHGYHLVGVAIQRYH